MVAAVGYKNYVSNQRYHDTVGETRNETENLVETDKDSVQYSWHPTQKAE